ncbi:MAG: hypothetical protein ABIU05_20210 [Nitrospirales bacterium]
MLLENLSEPCGEINAPALPILWSSQSAIGKVPSDLDEPTAKIHIPRLQCNRFTKSAPRAEQKQKERVIGRPAFLNGLEKDSLFLPAEWIHVLGSRFEFENLAGL